MQKRVMAISDISCMGKCSLTVALPIISAVGHECVIMPTALLSTHTAQKFGEYVSFDMTGQLQEIAHHWSSLDTKFDAIYSGYIVSAKQGEYIYNIINEFKSSNTLVVVDPILGDNGRLYRGFTSENIDAVRRLCSVADIITPNLTEGSLLTGINSDGQHIANDDLIKMIDALSRLCSKKIVITGVETEPNIISTVAHDCATGETVFHNKPRILGSVHGSGDIFASTLTAMSLTKSDFNKAVAAAVNFTYFAVADSKGDPDSRWYGVNFEKNLNKIKDL